MKCGWDDWVKCYITPVQVEYQEDKTQQMDMKVLRAFIHWFCEH